MGAPPEARKVLCNHRGAEVFGSLKMPDYLGADQRKTKEDEKDDKPIRGQLTQAGAPGRVRTSLGPAWGREWIPGCRSVGAAAGLTGFQSHGLCSCFTDRNSYSHAALRS